MPEAPNFIWGALDTGMSCVVLTMVPYRNVAVALDEVSVYEHGYKTNYVVLRNPTDRDLDKDPRFHKYMQSVIQQVLKSNAIKIPSNSHPNDPAQDMVSEHR